MARVEAQTEIRASAVSVDDPFGESPLDMGIRFQNSLISFSTGGRFDGDDEAYEDLRRHFAARPDTKDKVPDFVRRCRDLGQFWGFIKYERPTYQERRVLLWDAFRALIDYLETQDRSPGIGPITTIIEQFDPDNVHAAWQKALDRRLNDPEGAITAARMLLETVCKHILDKAQIAYSDREDLPRLWALAADNLNLAPHQHQEPIFKAILGNCQSVVNYLGSIRNKIGDAHGQGRRPVKPKARHAELAVNLAGTMAAFLISTWKDRQEPKDESA